MSEATSLHVTEYKDDNTVNNSVKENLTVDSNASREDSNMEGPDLNHVKDNSTEENSVSGYQKHNLDNDIKSRNGNVKSKLQCRSIDKFDNNATNRIKDEIVNSVSSDDKKCIEEGQSGESPRIASGVGKIKKQFGEECNGYSSGIKRRTSSRVRNVDKMNDNKIADKFEEMSLSIVKEKQSADNGAIPSEANEVSFKSERILYDSIDKTDKSDQGQLGRSDSSFSPDCKDGFERNGQNTDEKIKNNSNAFTKVPISETVLCSSESYVVHNDVKVKSDLSFDSVSTCEDVKNLSVIAKSNGDARLELGDDLFAPHDRKIDTSFTDSSWITDSLRNQTTPTRDQSLTSSDPICLSSEHHKSTKSKTKAPPDNTRPVGRILHDLGLDLVRQEVYKDLIDIQAAKDSNHQLDDKDKGQLIKLTEAHSKLKLRNHQYVLSRIRCARCKYVTTTRNVLVLHHEHGHCSRAGVHSCCICESFRTRYASQFITHMETVHSMNGRLAKKTCSPVCSYCPYEHKSSTKVEEHTTKCLKKFQLNTNLQPLPSDCDIPIRYKQPATGWTRSNPYEVSSSPGQHTLNMAMAMSATNAGAIRPQGGAGSRGSATAPVAQPPSVMEIGGQLYSWGNHNGKPLLTSLRSQMGSNNGAASVSPSSSSRNYNMVVPTTAALFQAPLLNVSAHQLLAQQQELSRSRTSLAPMMAPTPSPPRRVSCEICGVILESRLSLWMHLQSTHKVQLSRASMNEQEPIGCEMCKARFWTYQGLARHSLLLHKRNSGGGISSVDRGAAGGSTAPHLGSFKCHLCGVTQTSNPLNHLSTHHNVTLLDMYHGRQCCMCNRKMRTGRMFEEHMIHEHRDIFANIDVLRTVLQALSTALCLKSEDARTGPVQGSPSQQRQQQGSLQQRSQQQQTAMSSGSAAGLINSASHHPSSLINNNNNRSMSADVGLRSPPWTTPELTHSQKRKQSLPRASLKEEFLSPSAVSLVKTPDKKTTEEETRALNKLYEEYADIGRPISRSMKHKLLLSTPPSSAHVLNHPYVTDDKSNDVGLDLSVRKGRRDNGDDSSDKAVDLKRPCLEREDNVGSGSNSGDMKTVETLSLSDKNKTVSTVDDAA